ncbi:extracellular ribonuclease LE-like [Magnolia sinica]|uniref:extracellular ribonuclease LE-like n=1 Tax=Magnolia sinica TaxID=86752 RepID=UPI0026588114|nr:extracellular ribonuclease LE-like [Magnolia sinica]
MGGKKHPSNSSITEEMDTRIASASFLLSILFFSGAIVSADFDFFYYVLMWPGAYCKKEGCCLPTTGKPELDFFIEGMYPAKNSGEFVSKCDITTKFYVNEVADMISGMYAYWPNITCPSNNGLSSWKNLWEPYGNCMGLTEKEYFGGALQLRSTVNLLSNLGRADMVPNDNDYDSSLIYAAINDAVGGKTAMRCVETSWWWFWSKSQLSEVWFCVDKSGSTIINCPTYPKFTCGDKVTFGKFTYDMMKDTSESFNPIQMPTSLSE